MSTPSLLAQLALSPPDEPVTRVGPLVAGVVLFVAVLAMASIGALLWNGAAQTRGVIVAMAREIRSEMRAWVNSIGGWYRAPWRRHGRLIADLPLTPASAAKHGELIAVSGRVEAGDGEAEAGHLVLADESGGRIQIGRPGQALVTERFAVGDLVFAMGEVERLEHTGHPFRDAAPIATLVPGADRLFLVVRGPRDQACAELARQAAIARTTLTRVRWLVPLLVLTGLGALHLGMAGAILFVIALNVLR
jgi:hypothetical protein